MCLEVQSVVYSSTTTKGGSRLSAVAHFVASRCQTFDRRQLAQNSTRRLRTQNSNNRPQTKIARDVPLIRVLTLRETTKPQSAENSLQLSDLHTFVHGRVLSLQFVGHEFSKRSSSTQHNFGGTFISKLSSELQQSK